MRVLVVGDAASPHTRRFAASVAAAGPEVVVAGFGGPPLPGVEIVDLGSGTHRGRFLRGVPRLRRVLREVRPHVVNAHFVSSYGVMTDLAGPTAPVVATAWGSDVLWLSRRPGWHRGLVARALRRAAVVTYDSEDVCAIVAAVAPAVSRRCVRFGPERAWCEAPRAEQPVVLSSRRPVDFYNVDTVVAAFARVAPRFPGWRLDVLTYGLAVPGLEAQVSRLGLGDRVRFVPALGRAELRALLLSSAVFCSVPSSDAAAASLLEGMAAGSFPIVSDLPANREWIEHERNGLVVTARSVDGLATALAHAMASPGLRSRARAHNRPVIARTASWERSVDDVVQLFEQLVAREHALTA